MTDADDKIPLISTTPDGGYVMTCTDVPSALIVGRLAMGAARDELQAEYPRLTDDQLELTEVLGLSHAIGAGR